MKESLSVAEARRIALAAQGFAQPRPARPGTRQLNLAMARMATLQIDSVNVFARSHYMPLFARLGPYDTAALDRLLFARRAPYVEYWAHVASFIPAADWGLFRFRMDDLREKYGTKPDGWYRTHREIVDWVRSELAERGPAAPRRDRARCEEGGVADRGGTGTSSRTRSSISGCSARSRSRAGVVSSAATGSPSM